MDSDLNQDLAAHCEAKTPLKDPGDQPPGAYENENSSVTISVRPWFPLRRQVLLNLIPNGRQTGAPA